MPRLIRADGTPVELVTTRSPRRTHIIRANHKQEIPANRVYLDTEAYRERIAPGTERQTLWFGWALFERERLERSEPSYTERWIRFQTADEVFLALGEFARPKTATYVYAHNLSYDAAMISLASMAEKYGWVVTEYVQANRLLWVSMRKEGRSLIFLDTMNYFPTSLKSLGESIGSSKLTIPQETGSQEAWDAYCKQDVAVLQAAMRAYFGLLRSANLGDYRKTAAAQAFGAWRHRFMHHKVMILADPVIENLEREAYHGGRSEVFYDLPLSVPVYGVDVNSMYPAVMQTGVFPTQKCGQGKAMAVEQLFERLRHEAVIARVDIQTELPCYPYATGERIIYPVGSFRTVLSTPELTYALAHGHILTVYEWVSYETAPLFTDYVTTLYALRQAYKSQGNDAFSYLCKLLLNSLYGKFGQRGYIWKECTEYSDCPEGEFYGDCPAATAPLRHKQRMGKVWHQLTDGEAYESFPAIAAHVTAMGRMKLWGYIEQAGSLNVLYTDTDSLYVTTSGYKRLDGEIDGAKLGMLKLEGVYSNAHFRAAKDYIIDDYEKVKGVRKSARKIEASVYEQERFESYDAILARGADGEVIVTTVRKHLSRRNLQSVGEGVGWRTPRVLGVEPGAQS